MAELEGAIMLRRRDSRALGLVLFVAQSQMADGLERRGIGKI